MQRTIHQTICQPTVHQTIRRTLAIFALGVGLVVSSTTSYADSAPTGTELAKRWNKAYYYAAKTAKARIEMTIKSKSGKIRQRRFMMLRQDDSDLGDQKYFVYFQRPSDVRRMTLLVWKDATGDDDRWLYLPDLDLVKRIEGKQGRASFAGSDFLYEDISGRPVKVDKHKLEKTTNDYYVLLSVPKKRSSVDFDAYRVYIDKKTYLPHKAVYYRKGKKTRMIEMLATGSFDGYTTVTKARATNFATGSQTTIVLSKVRFDLNLPPGLFAEGSLRAAPSAAKR